MISKPGAGPVQKTGKYPCSVCSKGVGSNSIQCTKCKQWVHARCSRVKGKLAEVKDFVCNSCSSPHATFMDRISSKDLLTKFDLLPVRRIVQRNRLRWFGHAVRMDNDNWVKKCMTLKVYGRRDPGRPKKTWEQVIAS